MKRKIGFYFDSRKLGNFDFNAFLRGDVGLGGTDSQLLLLINELPEFYDVYLFTNWENNGNDKIKVVAVTDLRDAAVKAKQTGVELLIFTGSEVDATRQAIEKLNELQQPFVIWETIGPGKVFEKLLADSPFLKRIVCVSRTHANSHRHRRFFSKINFIYNGRDYDAATPQNAGDNNGNINIGYLGAVSPGKGFHWVAKAWPAIRKAFPQANLYVIGSIKTHNREAKTGTLDIAVPEFEEEFIKPFLGNNFEEIEKNGVHFTGNISPNEMKVYFKQLDLGIVNPNYGNFCETFCIAALDFQANHIPVVGANTGGLKESVSNGKTGILINDSNELATTIINLLKDKKKLAYLNRNSADWVRNNFSRQRISGDWKNLIDDVLDNRKNKLVSFGVKDISFKLLAMEMIRISRIPVS